MIVAAQNATRGPQWWYLTMLILITIISAITISLERFNSQGFLVGAVKN